MAGDAKGSNLKYILHGPRQAAESLLRSLIVVLAPPRLDDNLACARLVNQCSFRHSSLRRPLNDSMYALCIGFFGSMSRSVTPRACAHVSVARRSGGGRGCEGVRTKW